MRNFLLALTVLSAATLPALAAPDTVTLSDGTVVQSQLPGAPRGNEQSDKTDNTKKTYICHATSAVNTNGFLIIHVGHAAVPAHLDHEHGTPNGQGQEKEARDQVGVNIQSLCESQPQPY